MHDWYSKSVGLPFRPFPTEKDGFLFGSTRNGTNHNIDTAVNECTEEGAQTITLINLYA